MLGKLVIATSCCIAAMVVAWLGCNRPADRVTGPLPQEVYVWQRGWNEPVRAAVRTAATNFSRIIALSAEVTWNQGEPQATRAPLHYQSLQQNGRPVGLALRIGMFPGPFSADDSRARWLAALAATLLADAKSHQLAVSELQLDFDCAESKLAGYTLWVERIRLAVAPCPVVITALPSWLKRSAMGRLVRAADGYVLQVHSLARPGRIDQPLTLCDPAGARQAVEQAARLGRPFRVALPTYGYLTAFNPNGEFVGLAAEGPGRDWPEGTLTRAVRADPAAMSALIRDWNRNRPALMQGVIWYRLPVAGDQWNWTWPTLATVMAGQSPRADLRTRLRRPNPELVELDLENVGTADHIAPVRLNLRWHGARRVAGDALQGFHFHETARNALEFRSDPDFDRLSAGETRTVCWVRFDREVEVAIELH